jgi:small subunit ribosomal protein S15
MKEEEEMTKEKLYALVEKLAREGNPPSKIGLILRDQYGVGNVKEIAGKNLEKILEELGIKREIPEDLANLLRKAVTILNHLSKHKKDFRSKRALEIVEGKINALARYYIRSGKLPKDWKYERERAALLIK